MGETTAMLSYLLLLFIVYVYLPYTFFKFATEHSIDLGRRRDSTQLEEIISAFLPAVFLHGWAWVIYWVAKKFEIVENHIDIGMLASIAGDNRSVIADYVYSADFGGAIFYILSLWASAIFNGWWFGRAVLAACQKEDARYGLDELRRRAGPWKTRFVAWLRTDLSQCFQTKQAKDVAWYYVLPWLWWYRFFSEAIVPLFPWQANPPNVVIITLNEERTWLYYGQFIRYEKTTDGRLDAIRIRNAHQYEWDAGHRRFTLVHTGIRLLYLQWSKIHDIRVLGENASTAVLEQQAMADSPPAELDTPIRNNPWNSAILPLILSLTFVMATPSSIAQMRPCVETTEQCTQRPRGCGREKTPEALANQQSRDLASRDNIAPIRLPFDTFEELQRKANAKRWLPGLGAKDRQQYRNFITVKGEMIGENTLVEVFAYVVGQPHARRGESANCRFVNASYSNFLLNLAELPGDSDFDSVIAEIIPQKRNSEWTLLKLRKIAQGRIPIRVQGKLFYDNREVVNNDPERPVAGAPERLTVWEIHPVTQVLVCTWEDPKKCNALTDAGWESLADMQ